MNQPQLTPLLNRLLAILCRSFPQYLQYARPYIPLGNEDVVETFQSIVADQNGLAQRISQMVSSGLSWPRCGEFPMEFTDKNDLEIDFLIRAAIAYQEQDIAAISQLVEQLQSAPAAKALAEEALGMAKGHLDSLQDLLKSKLPDAADANAEPATVP